MYDATSRLCGEIAEINCLLKTFDKGVPENKLGEYVLDANDSFISSVTFANGAIGTIHSSRWALGHINSLKLYIAGDEGAIEVDLDRSYDEYRICTGAKNIDSASWKSVKCPPTPNNHQRFIRAIKRGSNDDNDFANGARIQACIHASMLSDKKRKPIKVDG